MFPYSLNCHVSLRNVYALYCKITVAMIAAVCFTHLTLENCWLLSGSWRRVCTCMAFTITQFWFMCNCGMCVCFEHQLEAERGLGFLPLCQLVHLFWIRLIGWLVQNRLKHSSSWSHYLCLLCLLFYFWSYVY